MNTDPVRFEPGCIVLQNQIFNTFVWIMEGSTVERKCRFRSGVSFDNGCRINAPIYLSGEVYFGTGCMIDGVEILDGKLLFYGNGRWAARTVNGDVLTSDRGVIPEDELKAWLYDVLK